MAKKIKENEISHEEKRQYYIVDKTILSASIQKVIAVNEMVKNEHISKHEGIRRTGLSRSTYYKYKDEIFELKSNTLGRKAELSMLLKHQNGALNKVIEVISNSKCNILSIYQAIPINNEATLSIQVDISNLNKDIDDLIDILKKIDFVKQVKLISIE